MTPKEFTRLRKHLGLSQTQLGAVIDMSQAHISEMESGRRPIQQTTALAMRFLELEHMAVAARIPEGLADETARIVRGLHAGMLRSL